MTRWVPKGSLFAAGLLFIVLALVSPRYGFHRDELYFIEAGRHPAWSYPDQPALVPLLATGWFEVVGGHLWAFRLLPALVSALTVLIASLSARELGADRRQQGWAAAATALTSIVPGTGHLFSTTTFDIFGTALTLWLLVRALRRRTVTAWLWMGVAAGITAEIKILIGAVLVCALAGILIAGPRSILRTPGPYVAALVMLGLAAPNLIWQTAHDWPMLQIGRSISEGDSTSSASRALLLPLMALMAGPLYAIVIGFGIRWLWSADPKRHPGTSYRWIVWATALFVLFTLATGGKPYYPAGLFPLLLAAGVLGLPQSSIRASRVLVAICAIPTVWFSLPVAPIGSVPFQIAAAVNPDGAETVGWPAFVRQVEQQSERLPRGSTVILAQNYGEAGALSLARRDGAALPPVYSGHNGYGEWGPPPTSVTSVLLVGDFDEEDIADWFGSCRQVDELRSPDGVDNEEDGAPIRVCQHQREPWEQLWPKVRRLG